MRSELFFSLQAMIERNMTLPSTCPTAIPFIRVQNAAKWPKAFQIFTRGAESSVKVLLQHFAASCSRWPQPIPFGVCIHTEHSQKLLLPRAWLMGNCFQAFDDVIPHPSPRQRQMNFAAGGDGVELRQNRRLTIRPLLSGVACLLPGRILRRT